MRTVVIDAAAMTYAVYEGRRLLPKYQASHLLDAQEVEQLRIGRIHPLEAA